jgi:hypothetical protein
MAVAAEVSLFGRVIAGLERPAQRVAIEVARSSLQLLGDQSGRPEAAQMCREPSSSAPASRE